MTKRFTVHAVYHKEISPGKGSIVWLLSDERGTPRKINGITAVDGNGVIDSIQAVYKRETPLIARLHNAQKGDSFAIDFSDYNQQCDYTPREAYNNLRGQEKASTLAANVTKVLVLLGAVVLLWFAYTAVSDLFQLKHNFPE